MTEIVFLGLTKGEWELINSFSNWLSAIGTLAAVVVSLWLATRAIRLQCKASVGHRLVIEAGAKGTPAEIIVFRVVNTGEKPIRITSIGWRVGLPFRRREAIQMFDRSQSSPLPVDLAHGQEAQWVVPLFNEEASWLSTFPKKMLRPNPLLQLLTLRALLTTSVGKTFFVKPETGLLKELAAAEKVAP